MNFFSRLFKPKWQHKNPQLRKQALLKLDMQDPAAQTIIKEMARSDQDPILRQIALKKIADLNVLKDIGDSDRDATVREQAMQRFRRLIAGIEAGCNALDREQWLPQLNEKDLEFVARQGIDAPLRRLAIDRITKEAIITDLAIADVDMGNRLYALGRITQKGSLERVAKSLRTRDKQVCAEAERRLAEQAEKEARPAKLAQKAKQLCTELESLTPTTENRGDYARGEENFQRLNKDWDAVITEWDQHECGFWNESLTARFNTARRRFEETIAKHRQQELESSAREAEYQPLRIEKKRIITSLEQIASGMTFDIVNNPREWNLLRTAYETTLNEWNHLQLLPISEETSWQLSFVDLKQKIDLFLNQADQLLEAQQFAQRIRQLVDSRDISATALRGLEEQWNILEKALPTVELVIFNKAIVNESLLALRATLDEQIEQRKVAVKQFKTFVEDLERALADGRVNDAQTLARSAQQMSQELSEGEMHRLRGQKWLQRLTKAQGQVKELLDWKGWATAPVKEQLCQDMETLLAELELNGERAQFDFNAAAKHIKELREQWTKLGSTAPDVEQKLKERFHNSANRAYEICHANFEKFAAERRKNYDTKEAICLHLEQYFEETIIGQDQIDWNAADKTAITAQKNWREVGPIDRKDYSTMNDRFKAALDKIYSAIKANKESNRARKQALIEQAKSITNNITAAGDEVALLRAGLDSIKILQRDWKTIGRASDDKILWQEFISICNQAFAEQKIQQETRRLKQQKLIEQRRTLSERIEQLAKLQGEELKLARSAIADISAQWNQLEPLPRDIAQNFDNRFRAALATYERQDEARVAALKCVKANALIKKAQLCQDLEILADEIIETPIARENALERVEQIKKSWEDIQSLDQDVEKALMHRFNKALDVILAIEDDVKPSVLIRLNEEKSENLRKCEELCLRLEVLADVPSPAEFMQARIKLQVSQLAGKLGRGEGQEVPSPDLFRQLERQWYSTGPVPKEKRHVLEQRFQNAWVNLKNKP